MRRVALALIVAAFALGAWGCDGRDTTHRAPPKPLKIDEAKLKAQADETAKRAITRDNVKAETDKLESAIRSELK